MSNLAEQRRNIINDQSETIEKLQKKVDDLNQRLPKLEFCNETLRSQSESKDS